MLHHIIRGRLFSGPETNQWINGCVTCVHACCDACIYFDVSLLEGDVFAWIGARGRPVGRQAGICTLEYLAEEIGCTSTFGV